MKLLVRVEVDTVELQRLAAGRTYCYRSQLDGGGGYGGRLLGELAGCSLVSNGN